MFLRPIELTDAAHRNAYRISRSHRKKKESYQDHQGGHQDYQGGNFDYDTAPQQHIPSGSGGEEQGGEEDYHQTEYVSGGKTGYSEGSGKPYTFNYQTKTQLVSDSGGLRSIAQGSADQANSAVANQELAAKQASYIAQNNLANLALQASATAMAALQGKQVLLAKIEQENLDAHQSLEVELQQLRQAKRSAKAAQQVSASVNNCIMRAFSIDHDFQLGKNAFHPQSAQQAMNHLTVLQGALK